MEVQGVSCAPSYHAEFTCDSGCPQSQRMCAHEHGHEGREVQGAHHAPLFPFQTCKKGAPLST
eukprot:1154449-Pelagomonas_calceolata.AAC.4